MKLRASVLGFIALFSASLVAKPSVTIGKQVFILAYEEKAKSGALREFLPLGESLDSWEHLVAIREFRTIAEPKQYIVSFAQQYRVQNPTAKFMITEDKVKGDWLIDFMHASPDPKVRFIEWNVFRARKAKEGIVVFQYAARYRYKDAVSEILAVVPKFGSEMSQIVYAAEFEEKDEPNQAP